MGLGRKNLVYSMALAGVMMLFLLGYFVCMLPSLYVEYVMEQNLKSVRRQHEAYIERGTYEGVPVKNSTACFSLEIPAEGDSVMVTGRGYSVELLVRDERLADVLGRCRAKLMGTMERGKAAEPLAGEGAPWGKRKGERHSPRYALLWKELEELKEIFRESAGAEGPAPVEFRMLYRQDVDAEFHNESAKMHYDSADRWILETSVEDSASRYVNYIAMERRPESLVLTFLPVVAPEMNEIRPIVLQSLPMLGAVILLMVLVFSQVYSGGIVSPVVELVRRAEQMRCSLAGVRREAGGRGIAESGSAVGRGGAESEHVEVRGSVERGLAGARREAGGTEGRPMGGRRSAESVECSLAGACREAGCTESEPVGARESAEHSLAGARGSAERKSAGGRRPGREGRDEVRQLADTLDDFYGQIQDSLCRLEEKNRELAEENKRQEIFLRASSHQLKTPVAAALLLVDGMINEVGRYKDTKTYLPRVKEQLLSMRGIVEDILYLNHCAEKIQPGQVEPERLLRERLRAYQAAVEEKRLRLELIPCEGLAVYTDEAVLSQILDNLLSNAVKYTPAGGGIRIALCRGEGCGEVRIENREAAIPEELLPHIFEPFVTGRHDADTAGIHSHGLGLYLAAYYAGKLGMTLRVSNGENCVAAVLGLGAVPD